MNEHELNSDQTAALKLLNGADNIFITGAAGSGKSFLLRHFLSGTKIPILASTGAAAILVGGRTFHSFFGLGIMEGGLTATVDRALKNKRLVSRLKKTSTVVIDEISMIAGPTLRAAETIAREVRGKPAAWGGIRVIAVGDFAQLPPVNPHSRLKEWAFLDESWQRSFFQAAHLQQPMRATDPEFLKILNHVRLGVANKQVVDFLNSRNQKPPEGEVTRLFPHRQSVEQYNLEWLEKINQPLHSFETTYTGTDRDIENFRKHSPLADVIQLKVDALIMLRQNDVEGRYVNGSLGRVQKISNSELIIELLNGRRVTVEKANFTLLDAEGRPVVSASNFPVSLAWAMTIHKAQGTTLDRVQVDLRRIWEPGQAYVALSRARGPEGLFVEGWSPQAIMADPLVQKFHSSLGESRSWSSSPPETCLA
ncbi:MAG: DEAD/DEAH box helicase [Bdellovibrionales bacterium]